jgi:hypothetical protein
MIRTILLSGRLNIAIDELDGFTASLLSPREQAPSIEQVNVEIEVEYSNADRFSRCLAGTAPRNLWADRL